MAPPKESKKDWEKERRDRLNIAFDNLQKLLPCFDPSIKLSKIEILEKATTYIEDVNKANEPLNQENENSQKQEAGTEIKKLCDRITRLLSRNELLNNLLKNAGIKIPKEYGFKKISPTKKWSQKISPNLAKILAQKEAQKENKPLKRKKCRTVPKVPIVKNKRINVKGHRRKNPVNKKPTIRLVNQNLLPVANMQPCYFISNSNNNGIRNLDQKANASTIPTVNALPSTTLLLTHNSLPTILPQPLFQSAPLIVKPSLPTYILVSASQSITNNSNQKFTSAVSDSSKVDTITKSLARIRPKKRNVTTTTQINKVPIPALTSSYGNNYLILSNNVANITSSPKKDISKKVKRSTKNENKEHLEEPASKKNKIVSEIINKESTLNNVMNAVVEDIIVDKKVDEQKESRIEMSNNSKVQSNDATSERPQKSAIPAENQPSESCLKSIVNITSNIIVPTSVKNLPTKAKEVEITSHIIKPEIEVSIKDSSNIISDKELLSSINNTTVKDIETIVNQTELSNDLFATLQVPAGSQNPESTSPTAAFLNAFPLVASKIQEVLEDETSDSRRDTPTLLQIGTMDVAKTTQTSTDNLTPSLMNLDNFAFFNAKDIYQPFENIATTTSSATEAIFTPVTVAAATKLAAGKVSSKISSKDAKIIFEHSTYTTSTLKATTLPTVSNHAQNLLQNNIPIKQHILHCNAIDAVKLDNITNQPKLSVNAKSTVNVVKKNLFPATPITTNSNAIISSASVKQSYYTSVTSTMQSSVSSFTYNSNKATKVSPEKYPKCNPIQQGSNVKINQILECNTLNPFTDIPKNSSTCSYNIPTTRTYSDIYGVNNNSHYNYQSDFTTNFNSNKQYYNKESNQSTNKYYGYDNYESYKNDKFDSNNLCATTANYYTEKNKFADQQKAVKSTDIIPKAPVNWMTTPDLKQTQINSDFLLFATNKESDQLPSYSQNSFNNNQNSYFNASTPIYPTIPSEYNIIPEPKKHFDLPFQRSEHEEHQINWSPTKHVGLDASHNFGVLPTLEGDLALGTQSSYVEPKLTPKKDLNYKANKESRRNIASNFEMSTNFLPISQLVDTFSKPAETPAKVTTRRNSGSRVKSNNNQSNRTKRGNVKPAIEPAKDNNATYNSKSTSKIQYKPVNNQNHQPHNSFIPDHNMWLSSNNSKATPANVVPSTSTSKNFSRTNYTAESLISHHHHHPQSDVASHSKSLRSNQQYNYHKSLPTPTFLPDNIMPYFPTMDVPAQDGNNQHNQTYGTNSFAAASFPVSVQNSYNNNYNLPTPSISTNYLQPPNYMPDIGNHDYGLLSDNIFSHAPNVKLNDNNTVNKHCSIKTPSKIAANNTKSDNQDNLAKKNQFNYPTSSSYIQNDQKKSKKKQITESTPSLSNIEFGILSMSGNFNSPILQDEFHSNFLPPPPNPHQIYPCKTPLYGTKQTTDLAPGNLLPLPPVTKSNIQHPEISPSNNIGTTLTNFNLSAIFPEINKNPIPSNNYLDCRSKHIPIPFSSKTNYNNNHSLTSSSTTFSNP